MDKEDRQPQIGNGSASHDAPQSNLNEEVPGNGETTYHTLTRRQVFRIPTCSACLLRNGDQEAMEGGAE